MIEVYILDGPDKGRILTTYRCSEIMTGKAKYKVEIEYKNGKQRYVGKVMK